MKATSDSGDHPKAQLTKDSGKHPQPHPGKKVTTMEAVPHLERPLTAPSWASEETWQALEGPPPGNMQKPSKAPLTGQEVKPPSQDITYNFVGRIWHSESVMEADRGSLESSPSPAMARTCHKRNPGGGPPQDLALGRQSWTSMSVPNLTENKRLWRETPLGKIVLNQVY